MIISVQYITLTHVGLGAVSLEPKNDPSDSDPSDSDPLDSDILDSDILSAKSGKNRVCVNSSLLSGLLLLLSLLFTVNQNVRISLSVYDLWTIVNTLSTDFCPLVVCL